MSLASPHLCFVFRVVLVCTAFPLNAVTLGNNLMVSATGHNCPPLGKDESWWDMVLGDLCKKRGSADDTEGLLIEDPDDISMLLTQPTFMFTADASVHTYNFVHFVALCFDVGLR